MVSASGGLFFCVFSIHRATKLLNERTTLRLHYEGLLEVGRHLEQLSHDGFHVYHGLPAETFNIDHVLVGPKGVFAVETKTHLKSVHKKRPEDATVEYDGRTLFFPRTEDYKTIDQAWKQAAWLSEWLGKAIGEPIAARAIVALPGWLVKRTSAEGIPVVNPQQFSSLFKYIKPRPLSNSMIICINHQLVQRCRNPEPIKSP
jgi:Nuclease-related domain